MHQRDELAACYTVLGDVLSILERANRQDVTFSHTQYTVTDRVGAGVPNAGMSNVSNVRNAEWV